MERVWKFAMLFASIWIIYGVIDLAVTVIKNHEVKFQAIYLIMGMGVSFIIARTEYKKSRNKDI